MIRYVKGDIFASDAEALINPVNTVGVSGKGLALEFKKRFPKNFESYRQACEKNVLKSGSIWMVRTEIEQPKYILNFPTKRHWQEDSKIEDIEEGLKRVAVAIHEFEIKKIAVPALGCGLGGLKWEQVKKTIEDNLGFLYMCETEVYEPK